MKTFKAMYEAEEARKKAELDLIRRHKRAWGIARKHALAFKKFFGETEMTVGVSYHEYSPCVDIDIHLGKNNPISDIYPLVDAMIRDPRLTMTEPLPKDLEDTDTLHCDFKEDSKKNTTIRIYVFIARSQVCVSVGTGKFKEVMRVACGHYDDMGNFIENESH